MKNPSGGIYYEINREHPMVKKIVEQDSELKAPLFALFNQIEYGLPLNQLYVDLNNDEQLNNDQEQNSAYVVTDLKAMLDMQANSADKIALLETMAGIEPFSGYPDAVDKLKNEVLKNG